MSGSITKRGLLAPQNTFLDTLLKTISPEQSSFVVANARLEDVPIVLVSDSFANLFGYEKSEIMFQSAKCTFIRSQIEDDCDQLDGPLEIEQKLDQLFNSGCKDSLEMPVQKKDKTTIWITFSVSPIFDDKDQVAFYLCWVKTLSRGRKRGNDAALPVIKGMGRFARLAKSVTTATRAGPSTRRVPVVEVPLKSTKGFPVNETGDAVGGENVEPANDQNLPKYMREAPRIPPYTILHTSSFKQSWNWAVFIFTIYTAFLAPFELVFSTEFHQPLNAEVISFCVDTAFILDIIISFRTTYVDNGMEVVSNGKLIRQNYLRGWFCVDLISSAPFELVEIVYGQISSEESKIITNLKILKLVRLLRLFRVLRTLDHYMEYAGGQLLMFLSLFVLFAHWFALAYFALGKTELELTYSWLNLLDDSFGTDIYPCCNSATNSTVSSSESVLIGYISSLYFSMSSMTTIGFGNIAASTKNEQLFGIALMFFGSLLYAMIFGNITTIFQQMSSQSTRYHAILKSIRDFMKIYSVPKDLSERVLDYVISTYSLTKGVNTEQVLSYTPKDMRADLCIHLNRTVLHEHPAFRMASEGCLRALAIAFQMQHNAPGDLLFHTGESIEELCFVASGSMEILQDDEIVALLGKGDVIGDKFWEEETLGQSACTVRALTYTDTHIISRESLMQILQFYEGFQFSFERNLILTYNLRRHFSFKKIEDHELEKKIEGARHQERLEEMSNDHPVRKILKGLRERIAREVYQRSASETTQEECALGKRSRKNTATEETVKAKKEPGLCTSRSLGSVTVSGQPNVKSEDPINRSQCNGNIPASPNRSLWPKSIARSSSTLSAASIFSVSELTSNFEVNGASTSATESPRQPRNIWGKLVTQSQKTRMEVQGSQSAASTSPMKIRDRMTSRKSPAGSETNRVAFAITSGSQKNSLEMKSEPSGSKDETSGQADEETNRREHKKFAKHARMSAKAENLDHLRDSIDMNHPILNDMLKLRKDYVHDIKRNEKRLDQINRTLWDALIAAENAQKQKQVPNRKISKQKKIVNDEGKISIGGTGQRDKNAKIDPLTEVEDIARV